MGRIMPYFSELEELNLVNNVALKYVATKAVSRG